MATKTSILIFYLRLSKNTERVLRIASWAVLVLVNVAGVVLTLLNIFQCRPIQAAFDNVSGTVQCIPLLTEFICSAPVNIVTDLAILALPLPVLTGMRLPRKQKIILVLTFALGVFVTIVDVVRIYYLQQAITDVSPGVSNNPAATFGDQPEFAWNASLSLMWSAVEVNIGVTCACIPTLKPLIIRILPAMIVDPEGTHRGSDGMDTKSRSQTSDRRPGDEGVSRISARRISFEPGILPPVVSTNGDGLNGEPSSLQFITTPDRPSLSVSPPVRRSDTIMSVGTPHTSGTEHSLYFGFVNMRRPKSMIRTPVPDSFKYCTLVTVLFFIWGFSYGLLNTLNNAIATVAHMTAAETLGLTSMYFGAGYFLGPLLIGEWVLRHDEHQRSKRSPNGTPTVGGFKATFMVGLCIYGVGTIMFWPSAVLTSFTGFMICNFVVGFGLAVLETAANPFVALCGPIDYAEMRLLISQGIQAIATVLSQLLAQKVFFKDVNSKESTDSTALLDVQWTYLSITLFCAALSLFLYYMPLPEVTDAEMESSTRYLPVDPKKRCFGGLQLRTWTLALAVMAQWTYVAGQESMSIAFQNLLIPDMAEERTESVSVVGSASSASDRKLAGTSLSVSDYLLIAHAAFAVSRFIAGYLAYLSPTHPKVPQPRTILTISTMLSIICGILVTTLHPTNQNLLAVPAILFFFFEGPLWPLIFALGLRGQGKRMKRASAWITMGASGPAFWPFVMYAVHAKGGSYQTSFALVPALLVITLLFSVFLDLKRDAQALVDARVGAEEQSRIQDGANRDMNLDEIITTRRDTTASVDPAQSQKPGFVKRLSIAITRGNGQRRRSSDQPVANHTEDKDDHG